ncbi:MAG: hypothetical protein ACTS6H_00875 [Candidatus Hodgkinia cicadicola]
MQYLVERMAWKPLWRKLFEEYAESVHRGSMNFEVSSTISAVSAERFEPLERTRWKSLKHDEFGIQLNQMWSPSKIGGKGFLGASHERNDRTKCCRPNSSVWLLMTWGTF